MAIFPFFREISFAAFLISGILGSVNYYKSGNLDLKTAGVLSAGSFVGALAGVKINLLIPADTMKMILYLVVLLSGISILLRKDKPGNTEKKAVQSVPFYLVLVFLLLPVLLVAHGIGVFAGSKNATKINQTLLKRIVAVASIAIACIKLFL
jgi:uncharacterized membrane protein YfcA